MSIRTNPARLRSGTVWLSIETDGADTNTELQDISTIKFDFDLKSSEQVINTIAMIPGAMTAKLDDRLSNLGSAYDALQAQIGGWQFTGASFYGRVPVTKATLFLLEHGQSVPSQFQFTLGWPDVQVDERTRILSLKLNPPSLTNTNVKTFLSNATFTGGLAPFDYQRTNSTAVVVTYRPAYAMGDFMNSVVNSLSDTGNTFFESGHVDTTTHPTLLSRVYPSASDLVDPDIQTPLFVNVSADNLYQNVIIYDILRSAALAEGAVYGSAFSVNFYTNRLINTANVTFGNNDVQDLRQVRTLPGSVSTIATAISNGNPGSGGAGIPSLFNQTNTVNYFPTTNGQTVQITAASFNPFLNIGESDAGIGNIVSNGDNATGEFSNSIVNVAQRSYSYPLSAIAGIETSQKIEATILGATKLKPYQTFKFDATAPERYQSNHYRPSYLEYDLKADTVKVSAYRIP